MPVHRGKTQKEKWYWACPACGKAMGVFGTEEDAQEDLDTRHAQVCSGNTSE